MIEVIKDSLNKIPDGFINISKAINKYKLDKFLVKHNNYTYFIAIYGTSYGLFNIKCRSFHCGYHEKNCRNLNEFIQYLINNKHKVYISNNKAEVK